MTPARHRRWLGLYQTVTLRDELIGQLEPDYPHAASLLAALRVPSGCYRLGAVVDTCDEALNSICDYVDAQQLIEARDLCRGLLKLLKVSPAFSNDTYPDLARLPAGITIDPGYRALPLRSTSESWTIITLREALVVRLLLAPSPDAVQVLADALLHGVSVTYALPRSQRSPLVRMQLLVRGMAIGQADRSVLAVLRDTVHILSELPPVRVEAAYPDNLAALLKLEDDLKTPPLPIPSRIQLNRLAREIGVTAVGQRRAYHTPIADRMPSHAALEGVLQAAKRWGDDERLALQACLILGRIGRHVLKSANTDSFCRLVRVGGEIWVERTLPPQRALVRQTDNVGHLAVGRILRLPVPRRLGHGLIDLCRSGRGATALSELSRLLKWLSRTTGQSATLGQLTACLEVGLESAVPDVALVTLLGMQADPGRDAAIHYFSPAANALQQRFQATVEGLAERLFWEVLAEGTSVPPANEFAYFGYSFRGDPVALRNLVHHVRAGSTLPRGRPSDQQRMQAYNCRVAYITLMYLAATGARPTGYVLPQRSEYSASDRVAIISDKDAVGYRSTRLVPLVTRVCDAIEDFAAWCDDKRLTCSTPGNDAPIFMLRDADGTLHAPTFEAMDRLVPGFAERWLWSHDVFRHHFRSKLWDLGCPTSWLRRVMAHHPRHASVDVPYAQRPLWDGLHDWDPLIEALLDELGFGDA